MDFRRISLISREGIVNDRETHEVAVLIQVRNVEGLSKAVAK